MNFETFNLDSKLTTNIKALGYISPTPIQTKAIPPILEGVDVMGLAQTGTGKTAAFVLPVLQRLLKRHGKNVSVMILAPTRELTEQTHKAIGQLAQKTGITCTTIYGGVGIAQQISRLRKGVDIISACPGRLLDHINRGTINLSQIEVLVLDEVDQMFDMGFLPDIKKIIKKLPVRRQNLMFSATMPANIKALAAEILNDPVTVQIGAIAPVDTVSHTFYSVRMDSKNTLLRRLLADTETNSVLVFTRTKRRSKIVADHLEKSGYDATALNGNLSQSRREKAMAGFRSGRYKILVATDVAARGLDVRGISHVINYDMPATADAYTHRIGRTGRAYAIGAAFTFVSGEDTEPLRAIQRVLGNKLNYIADEGANAYSQIYDRKSLSGRTTVSKWKSPSEGVLVSKRNSRPKRFRTKHR